MKNKRTLSILLVVSMVASLCVGMLSMAATNFTDVPSSYWAYKEIQYVVDKGMFNGTTATTFSPEAQMKRGQLAAVLYRYAGSPKVSGTSGYTDVSADRYYADAVTWAKQNDIFMDDKLDATKLNPDEGITRSEFAVMLYNFAVLNGKAEVDKNADNPFTDMVGVSDEIKTAMVNWAVPAGILNGTSASKMNPFGAIKRSHVAAMLYRYDTKIANPGSVVEEPEEETPDTPSTTDKDVYTAGDTLTLKRGGTYEVEIGVGEKVYLNDQLGEAWSSFDNNKFVDGKRVATVEKDSSKDAFVIVGNVASDVTLQFLSGNDFTTVLATVNVTVTSGSSSSGGNTGNTGSETGDLTEQEVYDAILALKSEYPEGMTWTNDNTYKGYGGCAAFGAICAEAAFGTTQGKVVNGYEGARVGDRIRYDGHTIVVLEDTGDSYIVAEGNYNNQIRWGREVPKSRLASYDGVYIETNW